MFETLANLLTHPSPQLVCETHTFIRKSPELVVAVRHVALPALSSAELSELERTVGDLPHVLEFYRTYGGLTLFQSAREEPGVGCAAAYWIAPPSDWRRIRSEVDDWFEMLDDDERPEILPEWVSNFVAIGQVPNSATFYLLPLEGADRGKVFEFSHDGFQFLELGVDFEDFVSWLARTDEEHLQRIGGDNRYYDGKSSKQWMPRRYISDGRV
jgi:hypothetical protein